MRLSAVVLLLLLAIPATACNFCGSDTPEGAVTCYNCGHRVTAVPFAPALEQTFEADLTGFTFPAQAFTGAITTAPDNVRLGKQALELTSNDALLKPGEFPVALIEPVPGETVRSILFWGKSSVPLPLAVAMTEKGGAAYVCMVCLTPVWQRIIVEASDFGPIKEAPDANGQLDVDQIANVFFADASLLAKELRMAPDLPAVRHVYVDALQLRAEHTRPPEPTTFAVPIDRADRDGVRWLTIGATTAGIVRRETHLAEADGALRIEYELTEKSPFLGLLHAAPASESLEGVHSIAVDLRCDQSSTFIIQMEERGGGKYNRALPNLLPNQWQTHVIRLRDLQPAEDSRDDNGQFDVDKLDTVLLLCVDGFLKRFGRYTLYVDNCLFIKDPGGLPQYDVSTGLPIYTGATFDREETQKAVDEVMRDPESRPEAANVAAYTVKTKPADIAQWYVARLPGYTLVENKAGKEITLCAIHDSTKTVYVINLRTDERKGAVIRLGQIVSQPLVKLYRGVEKLADSLGGEVEKTLGPPLKLNP